MTAVRSSDAVDHLVLGAPTLEAGIAWAEATLGVVPQRGGRHPQWGTHNALVSLGHGAYLEILARDPAAADADVLLFLHADTRLPPDADCLLLRALANSRSTWGRFDVRIAGRSALLPLVAAMMNGRSRLTGICTGDQAIFVTRGAFLALDGFAPIALMEDIDFSRRARRLTPPLALRARVTTSGRRWDEHGALRTIVRMWRLRLAYFLGADPAELARRYRAVR